MATVTELSGSRDVSIGSGQPSAVRRFLVDLPPHQALTGDHVGGGPGQLPALNSPYTVGSVTLFAADYRITGEGPSHSSVDVVYSYNGGQLNPIDPTAPSYRPFSFSSTIGAVTVPYVRKVLVRPPDKYEYPTVQVSVSRPEVILTLQVTLPIVNGQPDEVVLALITAETGKIHTIGGTSSWLFLGGDGDVVNYDRFRVTYAWKGVPPFNPGDPGSDFLPIPELLPHRYYIVVPGTQVNAYGSSDAQITPPTIITAEQFASGSINNLPGVA